MSPERSTRQLHNFSLPPVMNWGNQKLLRCLKISSPNESKSSNHRSKSAFHRHSKSPATSKFPYFAGSDGIEAVREKLMLDLRAAVDNMKVSITEGVSNDDDKDSAAEVAVAIAAARPWNLRSRRAACKEPIVKNVVNDQKMNVRFRDLDVANDDNGTVKKREENEKVSFSVSLSKKEVEDDYLEMIGTRPPRRPKKRPKAVQKNLDAMFPGLWLAEVTPESYKVDDPPS